VWARFFVHVQTGPGAHPASCTMGTMALTVHPLSKNFYLTYSLQILSETFILLRRIERDVIKKKVHWFSCHSYTLCIRKVVGSHPEAGYSERFTIAFLCLFPTFCWSSAPYWATSNLYYMFCTLLLSSYFICCYTVGDDEP